MIHPPPQGKYFEELTPGDIFRHAITRTVTDADNMLFCSLTHNPQPLHLDEEFSRGTMFGSRIVNSIYTLGLVVGVGVNELTLGTTLGNLGFGEVTFPKPVRIGDTLRAETEVISRRESKSRPGTGIVEFETRGYNQHDELVARARRQALMRCRPREANP